MGTSSWELIASYDIQGVQSRTEIHIERSPVENVYRGLLVQGGSRYTLLSQAKTAEDVINDSIPEACQRLNCNYSRVRRIFIV